MAAIKHVDTFKLRHIKAGEEIRAWSEGYIGEMMGTGKDKQHNGVLIVTGERVVFYRKGFFGEVLESIPIKAITSIERKSLMGHHTLRLHTSHDDLSFKTFIKSQEQALNEAIETGRNSIESANSSSSIPNSPIDQLKKLAELRDLGVISDDEFQSKKTDLLGRM